MVTTTFEFGLPTLGEAARAGKEDLSPRFVATTYLSDAAEYGFAVHILHESQHARIASPLYFLISQAIELLLKAFIVIHSGSSDVVQGRNIRHNLCGLLVMAEGRGFGGCSETARNLIATLHPLHETHYFRYRNRTPARWPSRTEAVAALDEFTKAISPAISKKISSHD
jgi:hypothetical protein